MINFQPFQHLYQQVKSKDMRLFEALDRISAYLKSLGSFADSLSAAGITSGNYLQASLPTNLTVLNKGFLANVTDYNHVLMWDGGKWVAGPNWDEPCYIRGFMVNPSGMGWKLCDGNGDDGNPIGVAHPVAYLKSDGTLGSIISSTIAPCIPNLVASYAFLQFGGTASGIVAAVAPTLTMNSYTPVGTVTQPTLSMNSYTPAGTVSQPTFTGNALGTHAHETPFGTDGVNGFQLTLYGYGTGHSVVRQWSTSAGSGTQGAFLTSAVSAGTPSGTVSSPTFSGSAATLTGTVSQPTFTGNAATLTGTVSTTGVPQSITLRPYFRK